MFWGLILFFILAFAYSLYEERNIKIYNLTLQKNSPIEVQVIENKKVNNLNAVMLHGWSCNKNEFLLLAKNLANSGVRVFLFDNPGHGDSKLNYSGDQRVVEKNASNIFELLIAQNLITPQKTFLVGWSVGARVAYSIAKKYQNFLSVFLVAPNYSSASLSGKSINSDLRVIVGKKDYLALSYMRQKAEVDSAHKFEFTYNEIEGAGHYDIFFTTKTIQIFILWLESFYKKTMPPMLSVHLRCVNVFCGFGIFLLFLLRLQSTKKSYLHGAPFLPLVKKTYALFLITHVLAFFLIKKALDFFPENIYFQGPFLIFMFLVGIANWAHFFFSGAFNFNISSFILFYKNEYRIVSYIFASIILLYIAAQLSVTMQFYNLELNTVRIKIFPIIFLMTIFYLYSLFLITKLICNEKKSDWLKSGFFIFMLPGFSLYLIGSESQALTWASILVFYFSLLVGFILWAKKFPLHFCVLIGGLLFSWYYSSAFMTISL